MFMQLSIESNDLHATLIKNQCFSCSCHQKQMCFMRLSTKTKIRMQLSSQSHHFHATVIKNLRCSCNCDKNKRRNNDLHARVTKNQRFACRCHPGTNLVKNQRALHDPIRSPRKQKASMILCDRLFGVWNYSGDKGGGRDLITPPPPRQAGSPVNGPRNTPENKNIEDL